MRVGLAAALSEAKDLAGVVREEHPEDGPGRVLVSGMLAEQLARELARGAQPGAVVAGDPAAVRGARVVVHVMAGEPSGADEALVRDADALGVPVVLVQLWPQEAWTPPFVLTPFVVECRPGEGFPVDEIASRMVEAAGSSPALARRAPMLRGTVRRSILRTAAVRAALIGAFSDKTRSSRPLLTLEQVRMLAELRALRERPSTGDGLPPLAVRAGAALAAGFVLRSAARSASRALPAPLVNATVAAAGTWALGMAFEQLEDRLG